MFFSFYEQDPKGLVEKKSHCFFSFFSGRSKKNLWDNLFKKKNFFYDNKPKKKKDFFFVLDIKLQISKIITDSGVKLEPKGRSLIGLCPFHEEKTPSFFVNDKKGIYHCFGCGATGNVSTFLKKLKNKKNESFSKSFYSKYDLLKNIKKIDSKPYFLGKQQSYPSSCSLVSFENLNILQIGWRYFFFLLANSILGKIFFELRGVSLTSIKIYGLGYSSSKKKGLWNYFLINEILQKEIIESGMIFFKKTSNSKIFLNYSNIKFSKYYYFDMFRERLIIPIRNSYGAIIGFGGRLVWNLKFAKYINSSDSDVFKKKKNLFSENIIKNSLFLKPKLILVTEGYMDVIVLFQNGLRFSIASLGSVVNLAQIQKSKKLTENKHIIFSFDSDQAGKNAIFNNFKKISKQINQDKTRFSVAIIPEFYSHKDPDEFVYYQGSSFFVKKILNNSSNILIWMEIFYFQNFFDSLVFFDFLFVQISFILGKIFSPVFSENFLKKTHKNLRQTSPYESNFFFFFSNILLQKIGKFNLKQKNKNFLSPNKNKKKAKYYYSFNLKIEQEKWEKASLFYALYFPKVKNDISQNYLGNEIFFSGHIKLLSQKFLFSDFFDFYSLLNNQKFDYFIQRICLDNLNREFVRILWEKNLGIENHFLIRSKYNKNIFNLTLENLFFFKLINQKNSLKKNLENLFIFYQQFNVMFDKNNKKINCLKYKSLIYISIERKKKSIIHIDAFLKKVRKGEI